jgi:SAM-dependent methyltransferase
VSERAAALTPELAAITGDTSLESYFWNSGWFTANVQLVADLKSEDAVIDIGCGSGRLAYGLYDWFGGRYVGVDIIPALIDYCQRRFPRYEFLLLNPRSELYNPEGSPDPAAARIPLPDGSFDLAVLLSVYTHLLPGRFELVTSEVSRLLKPDGRCLATFFILDEMGARAALAFRHEWASGCRTEKRESPEDAVAYRRAFIEDTFSAAGLTVARSYRGSWTGRGGLGFQDEILFRKSVAADGRQT